jgi:hypothetical protein
MASTSPVPGVSVTPTPYGGWPHCYRVSNGEVELILTADVGPRIIRFGFAGGRNLFAEMASQLGKSGEPDFRLRGGHRLWMAPEHAVKSWAPDNTAVHIATATDGLAARAPVEPVSGLEKEIEVRMAPSGAVTVTHRMRNRSGSILEVAPWAISVMAPGGVAVTAFPPRGTHPADLAPTNPLVMWAYTDFSDPRWCFTPKYLALRQDPRVEAPQKAGLFNPRTWAAYLLDGEAFVKRAQAQPGSPYPDFGCSFEMFTNAGFLELETLGPLAAVPPEGAVEHVERWSLHHGVRVADLSDPELDRALPALLESA